MDVLTIKGVEYQRVSALTKKFRYTADYIGQLCRAKKVDAQLVGRSWYVDPLSLESHKKSRHTKSRVRKVSEKTQLKKPKVTTSRVDVESTASKNIVKTTSQRIGNFAKRIDWKPVKYEYDESDLLPSLHDSIKTTSLDVNLAEATDLPIRNNSKSTRLVADELPAVSLKGKLKVDSLDESFDVDIENEDAVIQKSVDPVVVAKPKTTIEPIKSFEDRLSTKQEKVSLTPQSIVDTKNSIPKKNPKPISQKIYSGLLSLVVILIFFLIALLVVDSNQVANAVIYESTVSFSLDAFFLLFSYFSR